MIGMRYEKITPIISNIRRTLPKNIEDSPDGFYNDWVLDHKQKVSIRFFGETRFDFESIGFLMDGVYVAKFRSLTETIEIYRPAMIPACLYWFALYCECMDEIIKMAIAERGTLP